MTIAAISTPRGTGGVAIIRLSGANALSIAAKMFFPKKNVKVGDFVSHTVYLGALKCDGFCDESLCTYFKAPRSFTGEDVIEFSCHGGVVIAEGVLRRCLECGARAAECGEFTKRAFLNGKLTLSDAEGLVDMINAESESAANAAYFLLSGALSKTAVALQSTLTDLLAKIEVALDYPEQAEEPAANEINATLGGLIEGVETLIKSGDYGKIIKHGINAAIIGAPNVGKSSLLNALLKTDRAIVTEQAGTTRDTLSESLSIKDIRLNVLDTAGIRRLSQDGATSGAGGAAGGVVGTAGGNANIVGTVGKSLPPDAQIEALGIKRSYDAINYADIILFVFDASKRLSGGELQLLDEICKKNKKVIAVANKCDIKTVAQPAPKDRGIEAVAVSALCNVNIDAVAEAVYAYATSRALKNDITLTNERHISVLKTVRDALRSAAANAGHTTLDLIAIDLNEAYYQLGLITGTTANEQIIDAIFSKFCIGK
jgi:tRNA modification GTPase